MSDVLWLTAELEQNYIALQRFLTDTCISRKRNGGTKSSSKAGFLKKQNFKCIDCDFVFEPDSKGNYPTATIDHIIPYRYGSNIMMNSEYVCGVCNQERENNRIYHIKRYFGSIKYRK